MRKVELLGIQVEAESGLPLVLLREADEPHRVLPVVIGTAEANSIALALSGRNPPRPMTHDLMTNVLDKLGSHVDAVEVTELAEGTFLAELVLATPEGPHRIDTRPSDAIALAVRKGAPIYAAEAVLDEAGRLIAEDDEQTARDDEAPAAGLAPDQIEAEVEAFRSALEDLEDLGDLPGESGEAQDD